MSVFLTIPSARPVAEANICLAEFRRMGYKIALWRDDESPGIIADLILTGPYPGYARAVNALVKEVLARDPECDFCVAGGDDTMPDPNHTADEIAVQCSAHFERSFFVAPCELLEGLPIEQARTFGVMQPTGDRFAGGSIDRIAGSPWLGRAWSERMNGGQGPLWPEWQHMFVDEEAFCVATELGVYWPRPDLIHFHHHFMRADDSITSSAIGKPIPPHLIEANSPAHWNKYKALFDWRKANRFPGSAPIPAREVVSA